MNVTVFQLRASDEGPLHRAKLGALGDAPLGEHPAKEPVYVEDQGQAGSGAGEHGPIGDRVQGTMLRAH